MSKINCFILIRKNKNCFGREGSYLDEEDLFDWNEENQKRFDWYEEDKDLFDLCQEDRKLFA